MHPPLSSSFFLLLLPATPPSLPIVPSQLENVDPSGTGTGTAAADLPDQREDTLWKQRSGKGVNRRSGEVTYPSESDDLVQGHQ